MRENASEIYRRYLSAVNLNGQASAEAAGLNATDFYAMNILGLTGRMTSGELAEQTGLTTGATTRLIDRLERAGYVRRTVDPADRRRVMIEPIDPKASPEVSAAITPARQALAEVFGRYNKTELKTLFDYFERAAEAYLEATKALKAHSRSK
jgi:DNA-binding MarR family transcriptional regulator